MTMVFRENVAGAASMLILDTVIHRRIEREAGGLCVDLLVWSL